MIAVASKLGLLRTQYSGHYVINGAHADASPPDNAPSCSRYTMSKSPITCHVLDASTGKPAEGVVIRLQLLEVSKSGDGPDIFHPLAKGVTNADGRCLDLLPPPGSELALKEKTGLVAGQTYKIVFKTKEYFEATSRKSFYPWVEIAFVIEKPLDHYHIPLLISPYSFTTYRGS